MYADGKERDEVQRIKKNTTIQLMSMVRTLETTRDTFTPNTIILIEIVVENAWNITIKWIYGYR